MYCSRSDGNLLDYFSCHRNSEIMLHEHNEYIDVDVFLEGISVYEKLFLDLANVERLPEEAPAAIASDANGEPANKKRKT